MASDNHPSQDLAETLTVLRQVAESFQGHDLSRFPPIHITVNGNIIINPGRADPASGPLSEMEKNIMEALGEQTMTGEDLAKHAGYEFSSHFRTTLTSLTKRGLIGNRRPGYFAVTQCPDKRQDNA
jgi:hypothetical protein